MGRVSRCLCQLKRNIHRHHLKHLKRRQIRRSRRSYTPLELGIRTNSVTINGNDYIVNMNNAVFSFGNNGTAGTMNGAWSDPSNGNQQGAKNVPGVGTTLAAQPSGQQYFTLTNGTFTQTNTAGAGANDSGQWSVSGGAGLIQESTSVNGWAFGNRQYTNNWIVFGNNINLNPTLTTSNSTVYQQAQRLVSNGDGSVVLSGTINATMLNELVEAGAFATANGANITGIRNNNSGSDAMIWNNDYSNTNSFGGSAFGVANNITAGGKTLSTSDIAGAVVIGDGSTLNLLNKSGVTAAYGSFLEW